MNCFRPAYILCHQTVPESIRPWIIIRVVILPDRLHDIVIGRYADEAYARARLEQFIAMEKE